MAKYILQDLEGNDLDTKSKKDAAIKAATDQGLMRFRVVTDKGTVVYEQIPEGGDPSDTAEEPAEAPLGDDEDLIGATPTEPAPEAETEPETVFYEVLEFPGNYSIVTAPLAVQIAEAAGVPVKAENVRGSLTRKVQFGGDDMDLTARTVSLIQETVATALADLKVWQKKNAERRRGLTDMQRYLEHREFIAKAGNKVAKQVKKDGV